MINTPLLPNLTECVSIQLIRVLSEPEVRMRTRAMKALACIIDSDPSILSRVYSLSLSRYSSLLSLSLSLSLDSSLLSLSLSLDSSLLSLSSLDTVPYSLSLSLSR